MIVYSSVKLTLHYVFKGVLRKFVSVFKARWLKHASACIKQNQNQINFETQCFFVGVSRIRRFIKRSYIGSILPAVCGSHSTLKTKKKNLFIETCSILILNYVTSLSSQKKQNLLQNLLIYIDASINVWHFWNPNWSESIFQWNFSGKIENILLAIIK